MRDDRNGEIMRKASFFSFSNSLPNSVPINGFLVGPINSIVSRHKRILH